MVCVHQSVLINTYLTHYHSVEAQLACKAAGKHAHTHTHTTAGTHVNMNLCLRTHTFHHLVDDQIQFDRVISVQHYYNYVKISMLLGNNCMQNHQISVKKHQRVK